MELADVDKIDIIEHFDRKVEEIVSHQKRWKMQAVTWIVIIMVALISSGYINAKAIGGLQTKTEILWKEYVPGDLFLAVVHSFDLQNRYTLSLLNGNKEEAQRTHSNRGAGSHKTIDYGLCKMRLSIRYRIKMLGVWNSI